MASWEHARTRGERLKWVREEVMGHKSTRETERFLEGLHEDERPEETSWASVNRYEKDEREPRVSYTVVLSKYSGVSLVWICTGQGQPYDAPASAASRKLDLIRRIVLLPAPDEGVAHDAARLNEMLEFLEEAARPGGRIPRVVPKR